MVDAGRKGANRGLFGPAGGASKITEISGAGNMWDKLKLLAAPVLALSFLSASALQASGQEHAAAAPAATPVAVAPAGVELTSTDVNAWLDGFMPFALRNGDIAGAVVTVVRDGQVIANRGYGFSDLAHRTPVDPSATLFRPGSISKLFTWTAVMQLVEQGKLDLDADVNTYLDFQIPPYQGHPITLRQIMTHTSGFQEVIRDLIVTDAHGLTLGDYLRNNIPSRIYAPGTMPAYSNYATGLAGYIIQRVSGEEFPAYIQHHIFEPLGMQHASFEQPLPEAMRPNMSNGYKNVVDGEAQPFEIIPASPAGALSLTGADMALFMNAHLNDGAGLMRPETARMMHETVDQQFPGVNSMLLGFYQENQNGQRIIAHGGDTQWFHSNLSLLTDQHVGIFISVNSGGGPVPGARLLRWEFMRAFMDRYYPAPPLQEQVALPTAREHGALVAGDYESSRRAQTNPLLAVYFAGQSTVAMLPNGDLVGAPGLPTLNGAPKHWREVEPWVWQEVGGTDRMGARFENGRVTAIAAEPLAFAIPSTRAPWYRSKSLLMPLFLVALGVFFLTLVSWPVRAVMRRVHQRAFPYEGARAQAHRVSGIISLGVVLYLSAWIALLIWLMESLTSNVGNAMAGPLMTLYVAGVVPVLALVGSGFVNWRLWSPPSTWFAKVWGVLLLLSAVIVLWFAVAMQLFSFATRY